MLQYAKTSDKKWLSDVMLEQDKSGAVYGIVPTCLKERSSRISAGWGDAACIIPWEIYVAYGDKKLLKKHFPMMKKWVDYIRSAGSEKYLWLNGRHYGDWLAMDAGEDSYVGATSNDLIATAFYAYSTELLIKAGEAINKDVSEYRDLYSKIVDAFRLYFMKDGMPKEEFPYTEIAGKNPPCDTVRKGVTQTALTLILQFHLCTEEERIGLSKKLVELIEENGWRMATGFIGTPYLLHVLSENGYTDIAYRLLFQEKSPSWLYSVNHGATTMWEHWDCIKENGSFWSSEMNSFNHYAYGAVFDWIFGVACGIKPIEPAYKKISIEPHPSKDLGFVKCTLKTRNGVIQLHWYYKGNRAFYEISIPEGITACLKLPSGYTRELKGGKYIF